jgi:cell fate regulator YaaT (PSP1 superfamily)
MNPDPEEIGADQAEESVAETAPEEIIADQADKADALLVAEAEPEEPVAPPERQRMILAFDIPDDADAFPASRTAVGVSFRRSGKVYYFSTANVACEVGDRVIAATEKGIDIGEVVEFRPSFDQDDAPPLKPILRQATPEDIAHEADLQAREKEALRICEEKVIEHGLPMKLIEADYSFDGQRLVVFFGSEGRVDFRGLVRDLAEAFRCRIELRQIGVRDEAKMIGGYGPCGRQLCCTTFLRNFDAVGIKVAKDQGLALNPAKISGVCDRLMCCLKYEHEVYRYLSAKLPKIGSRIDTPKGEGVVRHVILLKEMVIAEVADGEYIEVRFGPPGPAPEGADQQAIEEAVFGGVAEGTDDSRPAGRRPGRQERQPKTREAPRRGQRAPQAPAEKAVEKAPAPARERTPAKAAEKGEHKPVPFVPPTGEAPEAAPSAPEGGSRRRRRGRRKRPAGATEQTQAQAQQTEGAAPPAAESAGAPAPSDAAKESGATEGAEAKPRQGRRRGRRGRSGGSGGQTQSGQQAQSGQSSQPPPQQPASEAPKAPQTGEQAPKGRRGGRPYYRRRGPKPGGGATDGGGGGSSTP